MREPDHDELRLLRLVESEGGSMSHDDRALAPFCDDDSTLTAPDTFNRCHDLGWLDSMHNHDLSTSTVYLTITGREVLAATAQ